MVSIMFSELYPLRNRLQYSLHSLNFKASLALETNAIQHVSVTFILKGLFFFSSTIKDLGASNSLNYIRHAICSALSDMVLMNSF
jgi:hypothetical protein